MSLDLYINSPKPVRHRGTGVYIRENGVTRELSTAEEVRAHFPDADTSNISIIEYETDYIWHGNVTHNLNKMAMNVPIGEHTLYEYLWRPDEIGVQYITEAFVNSIYMAFNHLKLHKDKLIEYNSDNGWGTYENLYDFCKSLVMCLTELDYTNNQYEIYASR